MLRTSKRSALIIVDMQADFMPGGALGVPGGDKIIPEIKRHAKMVDLVVVSRDWHPPDHSSFAKWGPHCVQRTPGAKIVPSLKRLAKYTISKGDQRDWEAYSAFVGHTLRPERTLQEILEKEDIGVVVVGGVALEICVQHTAFDANFLAFDTIVPLNITAALKEENKQATVEAMHRAGIQVCQYWSGVSRKLG